MKSVVRANRFILFLFLYQIFIGVLTAKINLGNFLGQLIYTFVPIIFYFCLSHKKVDEVISFQSISKKNFGLLILFALAVQPVMSLVSFISTSISKNYVGDMMPIIFSKPLWLVFIIYAVFPAISEEIIFRGIFFSGYKKIEFRKAIFINGIVFGAMHLNLQQFLYAFIMGIIFCILVYHTQSIFSSIIVHLIFNCTQIIMGYISYKNLFPVYIMQIGISEIFYYVSMAIIFLRISVYIFYLIIRNCETVADRKISVENFLTPSLIIFLAFSFFIMILH